MHGACVRRACDVERLRMARCCVSEPTWPAVEKTNELLQGARQGNSSAVEQLLGQHRPSLHRVIELRLDQRIKRRVDVSDIVQDVLLEANRRLRDYLDNPVLPFGVWIRQIAIDRIIDAHRRHRLSAKRSIDREYAHTVVGMKDSSLDLLGQIRDHELTPVAAATQREMVASVEQAIEKLGEDDREIILMRHYEQLGNQEVAQCLGLTEPAASMRYLRALKRLRGILAINTADGSRDASS